jgi:hypothetical protein
MTSWEAYRFRGSRWEVVGDDARQVYLANAYRVLMTRARQGLMVFVPEGDKEDGTRPARYYDPIFEFLVQCGLEQLAC